VVMGGGAGGGYSYYIISYKICMSDYNQNLLSDVVSYTQI